MTPFWEQKHQRSERRCRNNRFVMLRASLWQRAAATVAEIQLLDGETIVGCDGVVAIETRRSILVGSKKT